MDIQTLFNEALDRDPDQREKWLASAHHDPKVISRVRVLLQRHTEAQSFLEHTPPALGGTRATRSLSDVPLDQTNPPQGIDSEFGVSVMLRDAPGCDPAVDVSSSELPVQSRDSRYQIQGEIARGGMGAILKGRDTSLGRDLAVKVLLESHRDKADVVHRFVEEAQIGGQLQHPGIAPVYDISEFPDKRPFFTMKLVKGKTLAAMLEDRESPAEDRTRFLGIFEQVCQTMAYAHSRGVIHRDLKPANIMVGAFGEVQVMDWGLAKVLAAGGIADEKKARDSQFAQSIIETVRSSSGDTPALEGSQTQMGSVMGTPAYMPPEQALGEVDQLSHRSDVFALGAIACEILTGSPPYAHEDPVQVFRLASRCKLDDCFTRLNECEADVELKSLTRDCLSAEPRERPRDAGVVADRMARYQENLQTRLQKSELDRASQVVRLAEERKRRRVSQALAGAIIALIGVAGGGGFWMQTVRSQEAEKLAAANETLAETETQRADQEQQAKEQARRLLYAASVNLAHAELKNLNPTRAGELLDEQIPQAGEEDLRGFEWNYLKRLSTNEPKSETIQWAESFVMAKDSAWESSQKFIDSFSHDGSRTCAIVSGDGDTGEMLYVWSAVDGSEVLSRSVKELYPEFGDDDRDVMIALNHDGTLVAIGERRPYRGPSSSLISLVDVDSGAKIRDVKVFEGERYSLRFGFRPHSTDLVVITSSRPRHITTKKVEFQLDSWNLDSGEKRFTVDLGPAYFIKPPRFSGDGSTFAVHYRCSHSGMGADPGTLEQLTDPPGIRVYEAASGELKQVLDTMPWRSNHGFALNHDGSRLACCTNDWSSTWSDLDLDSETSLVIWDIESGRRVCQRETGISEARAKYSPDGSTLVVSGNQAGSRLEIYEAELATLLANANHEEPGVVSFSSDGRFVQLLDKRGARKTWAVSKNGFSSATTMDSAGPMSSSRDGQYYARIDYNARFAAAPGPNPVKSDIRVFDNSQQAVCIFEVSLPKRFVIPPAFSSDHSRLFAVDYPDNEDSYELVSFGIPNPGSRKTIARFDESENLEFLLAGSRPSQVLAATFTRESGDKKLTSSLRMWDVTDGTDRRLPLRGFPSGIQLSHDGRTVVVSHGSNQHWCSFFELQSGELIREFRTDFEFTELYFSHDDKRLAGLADGAEFVVLDAENGNRTLTIPTTPVSNSYLAFSADDDRLMIHSTIASGRTFQVYDAASGQQLLSAHYKGDGPGTHRFIPETQQFISCSFSGGPIIRDGSPIEGEE